MISLIRLVAAFAIAAPLAVSCSKDKDAGSLSFDRPAVFFSGPGEEEVVAFTARNIKTFTVSAKPAGWSDPVIDEASGEMIVVSPTQTGGDVAATGTLTVTGTPYKGSSVSASLFVGIVSTVDLTAEPANSYLVSKKETRYRIDATRKGNTDETIPTESVELIWQTSPSLIQYVDYDRGDVSFYVGADADDENRIKQGNAVIGAYDKSGNLLWSWHIWAADYDPEKDVLAYANGVRVMSRNLGALANANETPDEILASYGLYYQWGRKDPFVGPSTYTASSGSSAPIYDAAGKQVQLAFEKSSDRTGTAEYARQHPLTFITGVEESQYDWRWGDRSEALWADRKTVDDPCPAGWRVAPKNAFEGLAIADKSGSADKYYDKYGWMLTDGAVSSLYIGAGRRTYKDGKIQNLYVPVPRSRNEALEAQPWAGLYWTTGLESEARASAFYFWFDKRDVSQSGVDASVAHFRANGMSVRCVKE